MSLPKRRFLEECLKKGSTQLYFKLDSQGLQLPAEWDGGNTIRVSWEFGWPMEVNAQAVIVRIPKEVVPIELVLPWASITVIRSNVDGVYREWV